ncbi:hypothetical protein [Adlercreutzia sp. ZJ242]|uniref:DUF7723 family protein n=1 Tax=Adlercreutzia sp. ZJ242 TaxID=2709409 RepID=UPI0013EA1486|nr:hypothetical protein [Adlercreutzia sp. ZJ242]
MTDAQLMQIADAADLIVNGYAFAKEPDRIRILNLNNPGRACVVDLNFCVLETSMDDIEQGIALDYLRRNQDHLEN